MKKLTTLFFVLCLLSSVAGAEGGHDKDKGGPSPFTGTNQKVELADSEFYMLSGMIVIEPSQIGPGNMAYLKVDLEKQPWLANVHREETPYYPIDADPSLFTRYENKYVTFSCTAEGKIVTLNDGTQSYQIYLMPSDVDRKYK